MAFMLDNASNNDTLINAVVSQAGQQGIEMKADWVHLHCMSHTVHLAVLKVCCFNLDFSYNIIFWQLYSSLRVLELFLLQKVRRQCCTVETIKIPSLHPSPMHVMMTLPPKTMKTNKLSFPLRSIKTVIFFLQLRRFRCLNLLLTWY